MGSTDSDELLASRLEAACEGSPQALAELLEQVRPFLEPLAAAQLGSSLNAKQSASDLVQDTLIQVADKFSEFRGKTVGELRSWLARILEHRAVDIARRFRCDKRNVSRESPIGHDLVAQAQAHRDSPSERLAESEQRGAVNEYLDGLSAQQRQLVEFRYQDGLSFDEISRRMQVPRETIRRNWYVLIEQLGRRLESDDR